MRGEQVLLLIPDLVVQPAPEAELQHIQGQVPVQTAGQVTHGRQHRRAVHQAIQDQAQDHGAAQVTRNQVQVQAIPDQARLHAVVQATQDQAPVHEAARVIQDQAHHPGAAQAIQDRVPVHEAAQVTQDQVRHHVAAHLREGPAVRAGHPAAVQDPVTGDRKQFTYYFSIKHLSNF